MIRLHINNASEKIDSIDNKVLDAVLAKLESGEYDFVNILSQSEIVKSTAQVAQDIAEWADTLVVVGIGGSDLGGRAIQQALDEFDSRVEVIFVGDTTDPVVLDALVDELDIEKTVFNVVSKSGTTTEIMAYYLYFKELVQSKVNQKWARHFVFTTDKESGLLKQEADKHQVNTLEIQQGVGGRFSVLTPVGLLPAAAMELDLKKLIQGARDVVEEFTQMTYDSISYNLAAYQFAHQQDANNPLNISVMMPYSTRLNEFARWYRQLWAESLGKDGKGIMPIQAFGPADQHSQLQFYTQGLPLATYIFLKVKDHQSSHIIKNVDIEELKYLEGVDFHDLINIEYEATQTSLTNQERPNLTLELDKVNEYAMGQLFMLFELGVVILAEMLEVNAFDQPGVEESKQEMYKRLGRPGF